jgi:hypothetical protein
MGITDISQFNTSNKPNFKSLKEIYCEISMSFFPLQFLPTIFYKLAYEEA